MRKVFKKATAGSSGSNGYVHGKLGSKAATETTAAAGGKKAARGQDRGQQTLAAAT